MIARLRDTVVGGSIVAGATVITHQSPVPVTIGNPVTIGAVAPVPVEVVQHIGDPLNPYVGPIYVLSCVSRDNCP